MCIRNLTRRISLGRPLLCPSRALGQLPLILEEVGKIVVRPLRRRVRPGAFQAAGDGVGALAGAMAVLPPEPLLLEPCGLRRFADVAFRLGGAMGLAQGVSAGDQRHGLLVVHAHPAKSDPDVLGCGEGVGFAVRALGVDVNQTHLCGAQRLRELFPILGEALVREPLRLRSPVDVRRFVDVLAASRESKGLEPHRLERHVTRENHQVSPRQAAAVLLLDRPDQAARLVEVGVIGPAVEGREPNGARGSATATVEHAIGTGAVPRQPNHEAAVVAIIRRPPVLRCLEQLLDVLLDRDQVELLEGLGVVEGWVQRVAGRGVLFEHPQIQPIGPPIVDRVGLVVLVGLLRRVGLLHGRGGRRLRRGGRATERNYRPTNG